MSDETGHSTLVEGMIDYSRKLYFTLPYIKKEIPIAIVFSALGVEYEEYCDIITRGIDEQHKQNAQVLAKLKTLFPSISDSSWKDLLAEKGITSSLYGWIPFVDDEEDQLFRTA